MIKNTFYFFFVIIEDELSAEPYPKLRKDVRYLIDDA